MGVLDEGHVEVGFEQETLTIEEAVKVLLQGLGEDINREGLSKTPARVAKALREGTRGYRQKAKDIVQGALFPEAGLNNGIGHAGGVGGLVKCHVGYVPSGQCVVGLSKLSRSIVHFYGFKLQVQERITRQVAETVSSLLGGDVIVVVEASHSCMVSRGIEKLGSNTATMALLGRFSTDDTAKTMFLQRIQNTPTS
ncbi:unnamed protein product, partial [Vitis vinifera]